MSDDYEEHLPAYPLIQDEDFYKQVVRKKEFWGGNGDTFFRHQVNVARYMAQWTLYGSLFVAHEMGTGKSALTVAMTELARQPPRLFRKVVYVAHNQTQIANYKNEVRRFSARLARSVPEDAPRSKWNAVLAKDGYEFYTFGTFAGEFSKHTDAWVRQHYDNSIFIVDEAHHLVQSGKEEDKKSYQVLVRVLSLIPHRKLLVMSGTPVRDQPDEVAPLLNLVLPPNKQLSRAGFVDKFFEVRDHVAVFGSIRIPVYGWKPDGKEEFMRLIQGHVSYVKRTLSGATIRYEGAIYPPMTNIRIVAHRMDPFQNMVYTDIFRKERLGEEEGGKSSFYSGSKQASLFVFPDEQVGEKGFKACVSASFALRGGLLEAIGDYRNMSAGDVVAQLRQFSASYAYVIKEILDHPKELVCVFSDLVEGSGILLFMSVLKTLFGFKLITSKNELSDTKGERMILLNDRVANEDDFQDLIAYFNRPENKHGDYCQVVMTTNKTKEGISLRNVRQVHVLTPSWNIADTAQAVSRSIRARAHDDLGGDAVVRVFHHASIPFTGDEEDEEAWLAGRIPLTNDELLFSVDFQRYYRSEIKERNTKLIDRAFLEGSWDCLMNVPHNTLAGRIEDFSRDCEYDACEYECWGVGATDDIAKDVSNYNAFYGDEEQAAIVSRIRVFFSSHSQAPLGDLLQHLGSENPVLVRRCLQDVIDAPLVLRDYRRLPCFLSCKDGVLFLTDNPCMPASPLPYEAYYQRHPATRLERPLSDLLDGYFVRHRDRILPKLLRLMGDGSPNAKKLFLALPLHFQAEFCETMLLTQLTQPSRVGVDARSWFVREFKTDITYIPGVLIDHRFLDDKKRSRRLDLKNPSKGWQLM